MSKSPRPLRKVAAICAYSQEDGIILLALLVALLLPPPAGAQTQTFRGSMGRITGTASRDANGTVTYRDGMGRITGTVTTDSNGTKTFRDGSGRTTGTATRPTPTAPRRSEMPAVAPPARPGDGDEPKRGPACLRPLSDRRPTTQGCFHAERRARRDTQEGRGEVEHVAR